MTVAETLAELVVPIDSVRPYERNPRRGDVAAIRRSLEVNGQFRPIVVNRRTGEVLAGNHTWHAARELGWSGIAATFVDVDDEQAARIVLADNRTAQLGGFDDRELADLLASLPELDGTGFGSEDLAVLLAMLDRDAEPKPEIVPFELPENPVTRPGDIYDLGEHRLLCGDCRDPDQVRRLIDRPLAVAITSPPYADRRKYDGRSGFEPVRPDDYVEWFAPVPASIAEHLAEDGSWFLNIKPGVTPDGLDTELYVLDLVVAHVREWGWHFATEFCWERNGVPKAVTRRFRNQFEPIYQFTRGEWKMRPDAVRHYSENVPVAGGSGAGQTSWDQVHGTPDQLEFPGSGRLGWRKRKNGTAQLMSDIQGVSADAGRWAREGLAYPGNRLPTMAATHDATGHPAAFPVGLPDFFIRAYTDEGDAIYDPFVGSGSTLIAAEQLGRPCFGIDISPGYCDITVDRWEQATGRKAKRRRRARAAV